VKIAQLAGRAFLEPERAGENDGNQVVATEPSHIRRVREPIFACQTIAGVRQDIVINRASAHVVQNIAIIDCVGSPYVPQRDAGNRAVIGIGIVIRIAIVLCVSWRDGTKHESGDHKMPDLLVHGSISYDDLERIIRLVAAGINNRPPITG